MAPRKGDASLVAYFRKPGQSLRDVKQEVHQLTDQDHADLLAQL